MTKLSLVLILVVCFIQTGIGRKSSGGSSRGSIGGGGWSLGGSRGSSSSGGGGWGTVSQNRGNIGGGGWSAGGNRGSAGAGGWNTGGSNTGSKTSSGKKGIFGGLFGGKKSSGSSSSVGGKKKGSKLKTLKKAAVIGAVAYGGYKLGKLTSRFSNFGHSNNFGYGFNDWNRWRQQDGFLCRNNRDCSWIDPSLECDDYEFDFSPSNMWFGGDVASIRGQCQCRNNFLWNDNDLSCLRRNRGYSSAGGGGGGLGSLIISIIVILSMICS